MNKIFNPKLFTLIKTGISKQQLIKDSMAGIVVGIVALPLAIAFGVASGVSPEKGLITAIIAGVIISFLGGSRVQIGGPTGAFIIIVYAIIQNYGISGLMISTMLAGIIMIIFGLLRLGYLLRYIPQSLIIGFTSGIALTIFSTQIKDAFGLEINNIPSEFISKWGVYLTNISSVNYWALGITILTILISVYSKYVFSKIPGSFIAIVLITTLVYVFKIPVNTIETHFGDISGNFSVAIPDFNLSDIPNLIKPALTIALLGSIESLLSAVVADGMIGGKHRSNTELIAQGIANFFTPILGGIPATGAIARTATNIKNGGRTPIAGIVHAFTLLIIMLFFGKYAKLIPMSCLAGILIVVSYNMSEWRNFISIMKSSAFDIIILVSTFLLTVLVDLTVAIEIGMVLASILLMKRMADIADKKIITPEDNDIIEDYSDISKGITIYEISGPLFFASAKTYTEVIESISIKHKIIIIRMRRVSFVDQTGIYNFKSVINSLQSRGTQIILSGVNKEVNDDFKKSGINKLIGEENIFKLFADAKEKAEKYNAQLS